MCVCVCVCVCVYVYIYIYIPTDGQAVSRIFIISTSD